MQLVEADSVNLLVSVPLRPLTTGSRGSVAVRIWLWDNGRFLDSRMGAYLCSRHGASASNCSEGILDNALLSGNRCRSHRVTAISFSRNK